MNRWKFFVATMLVPVWLLLFPGVGYGQETATSRHTRSPKWPDQLKVTVGSKPLMPHTSIDKAKFIQQYNANKPYWDKAFQYLAETNFNSIAPGKYAIDGENVFATITEGPPKLSDTAKWESHRKYADIHYVISGKELISVCPLADAVQQQEYNQVRDIIFYKAKGKDYVVGQGSFLVLFPDQVHRPGVRVSGYDKVKKLFIKVRLSEN